jgi:NitT/TauT family transport system substrate-binding protein
MQRKHARIGLAVLVVAVAATLVAVSVSTAATSRTQADKVTLQLKWVTQSQFAGYYAAAAKGFYRAPTWT